MSIRFLIQSNRNPAPIYVRIRDGRKIDIKAKTNFIINPADWSDAKGQPKNLKSEPLKKLNQSLIDLKADLITDLNQRNGDEINIDWVKDFINPPAKGDEKPEDLIGYIDFYLERKKADIILGEIKESSLKLIQSVRSSLMKYQDGKGRTILIKNIDNDFRSDFEKFCIINNYAANTIARRIKVIKTICHHAFNNGLEISRQLASFKVKFQRIPFIYFDFKEIEQIQKADLKGKNYLENARDWLIISCNTGQRVSDFLRFDKSNIRIDKGKPLIEFKQQKTGEFIALPLLPEVQSILKKREGNFPRLISDQNYNLYIKEVCKLAGMTQKVNGSKINPKTNRKETGIYEKWELVTTHIGRRSFATNYYGKIPTPILMAATGHKTETSFLSYIGKTPTEKAHQLAEYF